MKEGKETKKERRREREGCQFAILLWGKKCSYEMATPYK